MKHTYIINGMTCQNCKAKVTTALKSIDGVLDADVSLEEQTAIITMEDHIELEVFKQHLPDQYKISLKETKTTAPEINSNEKSKLQQLKPLFLILFYIVAASSLMHYKTGNIQAMMLDFMGLFFIVFSFFKLLDLKGFATTFIMYDPVAKILPGYGRVYPFIEVVLGLMFLMRWNLTIALIATIILLGFTTYGVAKTLLSKRKIKCACLGTALDLPMTEATFIENTLMIIMSIVMLVVKM